MVFGDDVSEKEMVTKVNMALDQSPAAKGRQAALVEEAALERKVCGIGLRRK